MAKPKKKPEPGGSALVIDLTDAERQAIERAARDAGMPIDQYVKSRAIPPQEAEAKPFTPIGLGALKGLFPEDIDLDADLKVIRSAWEKEWDENGYFVDG